MPTHAAAAAVVSAVSSVELREARACAGREVGNKFGPGDAAGVGSASEAGHDEVVMLALL